MSKFDEMLSSTRDALTVQRVYGEPYESDGATFIPAVALRGGGGGGESEGGENQPAGVGGGFGMTARPVGAYQIRGGELSWVPAADTTRVIIASEMVLVVALLVLRSILKGRRSTA
jgi:uncharacterized spore protein YtfJ